MSEFHGPDLVDDDVRIYAFLLCHTVEKLFSISAILVYVIQNLLGSRVILKRLLDHCLRAADSSGHLTEILEWLEPLFQHSSE